MIFTHNNCNWFDYTEGAGSISSIPRSKYLSDLCRLSTLIAPCSTVVGLIPRSSKPGIPGVVCSSRCCWNGENSWEYNNYWRLLGNTVKVQVDTSGKYDRCCGDVVDTGVATRLNSKKCPYVSLVANPYLALQSSLSILVSSNSFPLFPFH